MKKLPKTARVTKKNPWISTGSSATITTGFYNDLKCKQSQFSSSFDSSEQKVLKPNYSNRNLGFKTYSVF